MKKFLWLFLFLTTCASVFSEDALLSLRDTKWVGTDGKNEVVISFLTNNYCILESNGMAPIKCSYLWNNKIETGSIDKNETEICVIRKINKKNLMINDGTTTIILSEFASMQGNFMFLKQTKWIGISSEKIFHLEFVSINRYKITESDNENELSNGNYSWNEKTKKGYLDSEDGSKIELTRLNNLKINTKQDDESYNSEYLVRFE